MTGLGLARRHTSRSIAVLCTLALAVVVASLGAQPAAALDGDLSRPELHLKPLDFVEGTNFREAEALGHTGPYPAEAATVTTHWWATDDSGICGYRFRTFNQVRGWFPWGEWGYETSWSTELSYPNLDDANDSWLGVQVRDCAGNTAKRKTPLGLAVLQDTEGSYSGSWGVSNCACWSGGTTHRTFEAGARVNFNRDFGQVSPSAYDRQGSAAVAMVMERAPDRGKARILVDGSRVALVDTYFSTANHRAVTWTGRIPIGSVHTLSVVNVGTAGRTRIDVDAVLVTVP